VSPPLLLTVYCLLIAAAALGGGWLPMLFRMSHTRMQLTMSFVGGAMLGVGFLHLLPHAYFELRDVYQTVWWLLGGFMAMFFMERVFQFHHHDAAPAADADCDHEEQSSHQHVHGQVAAHMHGGKDRKLSWKATLAGLLLHSALDGVALAASVAAMADRGEPMAGLVVFLAVFLHKPFDSLTLGTMMAVSRCTERQRHAVNFIYALGVPLGVVLFQLGADRLVSSPQHLVGIALAFAAGTFLCISTSDLLPELQFHSHDRFKLSAALLLGLTMTGLIVWLDEATHDHAHETHEAAHHEHE
jgi:zinc and cadmium transporter